VNGLALCAGAGGIELGITIAEPGYKCIAAIENDPHAVRLLRKRHPEARIFRDVVGFDGRPLVGLVDILTAGFPCQPHSVAGKRAGTADERWIWPDIARIIGECRPPIVFLENVAGLLRDAHGDTDGGAVDDEPADAMGGFGEVLRDLAQGGYVAEWLCVRASDVGASHQRNRVFILAYCDGNRDQFVHKSRLWNEFAGSGGNVAYRDGAGLPHARPSRQRKLQTQASEGILDRSCKCGGDVGHANEPGLEGWGQRLGECADQWAIGPPDDRLGQFAPGSASSDWPGILAAHPDLAPALSPIEKAIAIAVQEGIDPVQAETESGLCGLADGVARWLVQRRPRLQRGGNGVVPLQAAAAYAELKRRLK